MRALFASLLAAALLLGRWTARLAGEPRATTAADLAASRGSQPARRVSASTLPHPRRLTKAAGVTPGASRLRGRRV